MEIWERYILSPRTTYNNHGSSDKCWLVAYDTVTEDFVKIKNSRAYAKFKDSREAFRFLNKIGGEANV